MAVPSENLIHTWVVYLRPEPAALVRPPSNNLEGGTFSA